MQRCLAHAVTTACYWLDSCGVVCRDDTWHEPSCFRQSGQFSWRRPESVDFSAASRKKYIKPSNFGSCRYAPSKKVSLLMAIFLLQPAQHSMNPVTQPFFSHQHERMTTWLTLRSFPDETVLLVVLQYSLLSSAHDRTEFKDIHRMKSDVWTSRRMKWWLHCSDSCLYRRHRPHDCH